MYLPTRLWLDADDSADLAQYETDLNNYMNNSFASFIKGHHGPGQGLGQLCRRTGQDRSE